MAKITFTSTPTHSTDAEFRAWGKSVSDALTALGLVFTSDPQIDWTTTAKPTGSAFAVIEEFRVFGSTLQSTAPMYLKVGYGLGNPVSAQFLRFTMYKSTTGAGVGVDSLGGVWCATSTASSTPGTCYISYMDGTWLCIAMWVGSRGTACVLERSVAPDGTATPYGMFSAYSHDSIGSQNHLIQGINYSTKTSLANLITKWNVIPPSTSGLTNATAAPMFQCNMTDGQGNWWKPRSLVAYMTADAGALTPTPLPGLGTYLPLGTVLSTSNLYTSQASSWAMRWE